MHRPNNIAKSMNQKPIKPQRGIDKSTIVVGDSLDLSQKQSKWQENQ